MVSDGETISEQGGNCGQHLTQVTKVEMEREDKKKVQLKDVDCKRLLLLLSKRETGASMESPRQVGMFRVSPPH